MSYVLVRTDQGGGYVTPSGFGASYTHALQHAKKFPTREAAEKDRCPGNEIIVPLEEA